MKYIISLLFSVPSLFYLVHSVGTLTSLAIVGTITGYSIWVHE